MSDVVFLSPFGFHADPEPILRDVFSGWELGNGIFDVLSTTADMPWKDVETVYNEVLDVSYFGNHSGGKFCSPLVKLVLNDDGEVPQQARVMIAKILISKYLVNWQRLWETNIVAYDPVTNYDMTEERNLTKSDSEAEVEAGTLSRDASETQEYGKEETTTHGRTNQEMNYRYGINTDLLDPKPSDRIDSTEGGTTVVTDSGSDTTESSLEDTTSKNRNKVGAGVEAETIHRIGNIGVTTNQKLVQEERALWIWNYFDQIFNDIDNELALAFHDPCRV